MSWTRLCAALLLAWHLVAPATSAEVPAASKNALLQLQASWEAESSQRTVSARSALLWDPDTDPCDAQWTGVHCMCFALSGAIAPPPCSDAASPDVHELSLAGLLQGPGYRLRGTLPNVVSNLTQLHRLEITDQLLTGVLPPSLFTHPTLQIVRLTNNYFYGPVMPEAARISLSVLDVRYNMLSGPLPALLCNLTDLRLDGNTLLCGAVPSCLRAEGVVDSAYDTGLHVVGADPHDCSDPLPSCTMPPRPMADTVGAVEPEYASKVCAISPSSPVLGNIPFTLRFSQLTDVDALVLLITDHAFVAHRAWFWLDKEAQAVAGIPLVCCPCSSSAVS